MHGVILHFLDSTDSVLNKAESVGIINENCHSNKDEFFFFWLYNDYETEYEKVEKDNLESLLGSKPVSSFQLLSRYPSARFALKKVIELFEITRGVMDDDIENLWTLGTIKERCKLKSKPTIYNLGEEE